MNNHITETINYVLHRMTLLKSKKDMRALYKEFETWIDIYKHPK